MVDVSMVDVSMVDVSMVDVSMVDVSMVDVSMVDENVRRSKSNAPEDSGVNFLQRIGGHVQGKALVGFMELVPLLVSEIVIWFVIGWTDQFVRPMSFVSEKPWDVPGIGVVAAVIIFYLVGLVVSTRIGKTIMDREHDVLHRIPIVKTIYGVTYQATTSRIVVHPAEYC